MGKHKHRVRVSLTQLEQPEISLGTLLGKGSGGSAGDASQKKRKKHKKKHKHGSSSLFGHDDDDDDPYTGGGGFMTQLQQKYCGHAKLKSDDEEEDDNSTGAKKRKKRTAADDMYELDDDFIDDSELFEVFEKQQEAETVLTKYTGFFVNKGELEIIKDPSQPEPSQKPKKKRVRVNNNNNNEERAAKENDGSATKKKAAAGGSTGASNATTTTTGTAGGESSSNEKSTVADEAGALAAFQQQVAAWLAPRGAAGAPEELPSELALPALTLDLVLRRPGGDKKYKSTQPGESGMSATYIEMVLQATLPLAAGVDGGATAWRKGLIKAAVLRVKELQKKVNDGLQEFRRHYDQRKEKLAAKAAASKTEGGGGEGGGGAGDMAAPAAAVPIFDKLKQYMYVVLSSFKEKHAIQTVYAGEGEGQEERELLPLVTPNFSVEERVLLTELANTWPNDTMKIPRLRRAFNAYKASLQQGGGGGGGGGGGDGGGGGAEAGEGGGTGGGGGPGPSKKPRVQKDGKAGADGEGAKKKPIKKKKKKKPWKGSFASLRPQPYNAADFELEGATKVVVAQGDK